MPNMTISLPDELHRKAKQYSFVNWSAVCRIAVRKTVEVIEKENVSAEQLENKLFQLMLSILK
jgi:hypothetical protein